MAFLGLLMTRPSPVLSPAGPGPGHLGSGLVWTWVCQVQDQTLDSLVAAVVECDYMSLVTASSSTHPLTTSSMTTTTI